MSYRKHLMTRDESPSELYKAEEVGTDLAEVGKDVPDISVGEFISRQAAIDYFVTNVGFHDEDGYPIEDTDELRKIWTEYFSGIPSAEPQRMRAKWIATTALQEGQITWRDYKCSNCSHHRGKPMNYCEICGAKMEVTE